MDEPQYRASLLGRISEVSEAAWDALLPKGRHPFLKWAFLNALEESGSACSETGWQPLHLWLKDDAGQVIGAAPLYGKSHSQGEYVFDHGWADALHRAGLDYYPKLQCAIPFTPATSPRLLAGTPAHKELLASAMQQICRQQNFSSIHATFLQADDRDAFEKNRYLLRRDRQFHFINRGYQSFDDFLASLTSRKRKNIRKERRAAQEGLVIKRLTGDDLKPEHWDIFYDCYLDTGQRKWGRPYLTRAFFDHIHSVMRDDILLVMAWDDGTPIASALNFIGSDALYGRNWGCLSHKPFLHFELCYYQAIEAGIERGLPTVEAGAQGEHKLARGYEPVITTSAHYMAHTGLHAAIEDYLTHERLAVDHDVKILDTHTPFKTR
jgi:predicted N-acyltransferase